MRGARRSLVRRLIAYQALDEFMPIFPIYALLFADNGLSTAEISSLLVLWSVVTFVLEVPSGAWADIVSRRFLLCLSSIAYGAAFATWVLVPTYVGFAVGFALWGLSSALSSGTFQALAYDELVALDTDDGSSVTEQYARVIGIGTSAALVAMTLATVLAAPLVAVGGYALTGWVSVAVCAVQLLVARSLPSSPVVISVADVDAVENEPSARLAAIEAGPVAVRTAAAGFLGRYLHALRTGISEATTSRVVRGAILASAVLLGMLAFDEYFGLMLSEQGASLVAIPLLLTIPTAGQALGGLLAGRAAGWSGARIGWVVVLAGLCLLGGALTDHPAGIVAIGLGYGALQLAIVVTDVRLQDSIARGARATVTSVAGLLSEVVAVAVYAGFAWGSRAFTITAMVGILAAIVIVLGPLVSRWLPAAGVHPSCTDCG